MSRSFKKPFIGISADSDKKGKQAANRLFRRVNKIRINCDMDTKEMYAVFNQYGMPKDGKKFFPESIKSYRK